MRVDPAFWLHRRVLVTGHTGFKGIWLSARLLVLGAEVAGLAREPEHARPLFDALDLARRLDHHPVDLRDAEAVRRIVRRVRPEIVFHLAAQPLVLEGLRRPVETFATNLLGTVHLLEALRDEPDLRAVVVATSDKVYREGAGRRREEDPLGGDDPYSASKAAAELAVACWRRCYLTPEDGVGLATARAGNVVGAGDFAPHRLVPDAVRALVRGEPVVLRHPGHRRPWQHVLDAVRGYLLLAQRLAEAPSETPAAFNFGPGDDPPPTVRELVERLLAAWGGGAWRVRPGAGETVERPHLALDAGRAWAYLGWRPLLDLDETVVWTVAGYRALLREGRADFVTEQIERHAARERAPVARREESRVEA